MIGMARFWFWWSVWFGLGAAAALPVAIALRMTVLAIVCGVSVLVHLVTVIYWRRELRLLRAPEELLP